MQFDYKSFIYYLHSVQMQPFNLLLYLMFVGSLFSTGQSLQLIKSANASMTLMTRWFNSMIHSQTLLADNPSNLASLITGHDYDGQFTSTIRPMLSYIESQNGDLSLYFEEVFDRITDDTNKNAINLKVFLFDPEYSDQRVLEILINLDKFGENSWEKNNATVVVTRFFKERPIGEDQKISGVNYRIDLKNLVSNKSEEITVNMVISGPGFSLSGQGVYADKTIETLGYCLYVTGVTVLQIVCAFMVLKKMQNENPGMTCKLSLVTLCLCNIEDFSLTMNHIQYIMSSESAFLLFSLPAMAYIVLFIIFDMKILFLAWRNHNFRDLDNPHMLRKKLTSFYIQFYFGLFGFLVLTYFFQLDGWFIILQNLILLPQIVHNARIGNNPGFSTYYVVGYLGLRLMLPLYFQSCPDNRFDLSPDVGLAIGLVLAYAAQIALLYLQFKCGSRFFIPRRFLPNYYDYNFKLQQDQHNKDYDCTICLQNIFAAEVSINQLHAELLVESNVMRTPCNHDFHRECLSQWMDVKLECPTCRAQLPPL